MRKTVLHSLGDRGRRESEGVGFPADSIFFLLDQKAPRMDKVNPIYGVSKEEKAINKD